MILRELLLNVHNNKEARSDKPRKKNWFIEQYEKHNDNPTISLYN